MPFPGKKASFYKSRQHASIVFQIIGSVRPDIGSGSPTKT